MSDIQRMEGTFDPPESGEETAVLTGFAPVSTMRSYPMEVVSYTRGRGHLSLTLDGYRPCHNAQEVIAAIGYEPEHDLDNPADSVFCAHGAGFVVPWDQVRSHMHVDSGWGKSTRPEQEAAVPQRRRLLIAGLHLHIAADDLDRIQRKPRHASVHRKLLVRMGKPVD